ncbi:MAG: DNA polymerase [Nanoarchaeota archaeon]
MNIAIRVLTEKIKSKQPEGEDKPPRLPFHYPNKKFNRVFVFDTETTADEFLNLKFGYFEVLEFHQREYGGLFYDEYNVNKEEADILKKYAEKHVLRLFTLDEFMEIFFLEVYERRSLCVGFNLKFDLSRLIQDYSPGRKEGKGGFSLTLFKNTFRPRLRIKQFTGRYFNIQFVRGEGKEKGENGKLKKIFSGYFLDVQNLACTLTDERSLSLEKACDLFQTKIKKKEVKTHGKITPEYIDYNIIDVQATYEVYKKVIREFKEYGLDLNPTKVMSAASLGKQALRQLNIMPFNILNNNFSNETLGKIMSGYYGGRCEVKIRREPTKVTVLDFFSTYPTITLLLDIWKFVIAEKISCDDNTLEVQKMIDEFNEERAFDKNVWNNCVQLVELVPDGDILPFRGDYDENSGSYTIGVNPFTHNKSLYYFLPDVLASVLLSGKRPKILKAWKFTAEGVQKQLTRDSVYKILIDPRTDNPFRLLVEKRQEIKNKMKVVEKEKGKESSEYKMLDCQQRALKILNNATSYGIYIELHPQKEIDNINIYSDKQFVSEGKLEKQGTYFNPIIGSVITSGARLLLALCEKCILDKGENHAYMDTDSCFVPPHLADEIRENFRKLNPYSFDKSILEMEEGMEDIWFYGISSKRYCLYRKEGEKIIIPDGKKLFYKLHGLGYLTNPFAKKNETDEDQKWHKEVWKDILRMHYDPESESKIIEYYDNYFSISPFSISTSYLLDRFRIFNEGKPLHEHIKPLNFILVGYGRQINKEGKIIKPIAPLNDNPQEIVKKPFVDYKSKTGKIYQGKEYWKTLGKTFEDYISHPESKFEGSIGLLRRKHIFPEKVIYIGKESDEVELDPLESHMNEIYEDLEKFREFIIKLTPEEARKIGIKHRSALQKLKLAAEDRTKEISLNTPNRRKVIKFYNLTKRENPSL